MVLVTEVNRVEAERVVGGLGSLQSSWERSESASLVKGREVRGRWRPKVETASSLWTTRRYATGLWRVQRWVGNRLSKQGHF